MKAATIARYGSPGVIEVREVPAPVPGPNEVLVRVHATTVNRTDCGELLHPTLVRLLSGAGWSRRNILGLDFAGIVEGVGAAASLFKPGDRVFGMCPSRKDGAQAEYICMPESGAISQMPTNLRFDQAVVSEGAFYANPIIEHFALKPGHRILIYGASGAIGTSALQLAKDRGAEVVAVVAGRHLGLARSLELIRWWTIQPMNSINLAAASTSCWTQWESWASVNGGDGSSPKAFSRQRIAVLGRRICCSYSGRRSPEAGAW